MFRVDASRQARCANVVPLFVLVFFSMVGRGRRWRCRGVTGVSAVSLSIAQLASRYVYYPSPLINLGDLLEPLRLVRHSRTWHLAHHQPFSPRAQTLPKPSRTYLLAAPRDELREHQQPYPKYSYIARFSRAHREEQRRDFRSRAAIDLRDRPWPVLASLATLEAQVHHEYSVRLLFTFICLTQIQVLRIASRREQALQYDSGPS